jgi:23S rRNA pseudouridine2604 synthase
MVLTHRFDGAEPMRVNKWLAQAGVCSRREAEALIASGRVKVDGERVSDPGRKIEPGQTLTIDEAGAGALASKLSVVLHKPVGFVSAHAEGDQINAVRLLRREAVQGPPPPVWPNAQHRLAPVGRLDQDSRGLLILSEDGVLAKAVIGPESPIDKEYEVRVTGPLTERKLAWLRHGLSLDDKPLKPAKVTPIDRQTLRFVLIEGRYRQIRRMCELVELEVVDLLRTRVGPVTLADLPEGHWRVLGGEERAGLVAASQTARGGTGLRSRL